MRGKLLAALVCVAALAAVSASTAGAGGKTECSGFFVDQTINGGLVANDGDFCFVVGSTIRGGFTVNGGFLFVEGSTINGGWSIGGDAIPFGDFCANNVNGGLTLNGNTSGGTFAFGELNAGCVGGTINGGATLTNNAGTVELDGYTVNGGLTFIGAPVFNELEATAVQGSATCLNVSDDGSSAPLVNSFTGQNTGCPA